jgi:hypothetical protein
MDRRDSREFVSERFESKSRSFEIHKLKINLQPKDRRKNAKNNLYCFFVVLFPSLR